MNLDPADAVYNGGDTGGLSNNNFNAGTPDWSRGLTFHITFTPSAGDLTGTVLLMEIGGNANGTGLYLIDGSPVFVSKQNSGNGQTPNSLNDLNLSNREMAVRHSFGDLSAGVAYDIAAIMNTDAAPSIGTLDFLLHDGATGQIIHDARTIAGAGPSRNWSGNNSLSVGINDASPGGRGALSNDATSGIWYSGDAKDLAGSVQQALYWNAVPTPAAAQAALVGLAMLALRRPRARQAGG